MNGTGEVTCPFESNCDYEECNNQNVQIFETVVSSFMVEKDYIAFWTEHLAPEYRMDDFGRTVFLTREEAEKALVEQGDSHGYKAVVPEKVVTDMTVAELKAYADGKGIDLGDLTKKEDILTKITGGQ